MDQFLNLKKGLSFSVVREYPTGSEMVVIFLESYYFLPLCPSLPENDILVGVLAGCRVGFAIENQ